MKVSIRFAKPSQAGKIAKLINRESKKSGAVMEVTEDEVKRWIKNRNSVVAMHGGVVIGHEALNVWPECGWVELRSAVVKAEFRGKGIGYMLAKKLISRHMKKNRTITFISIKRDAGKGAGILSALGFEEVSMDEIPGELFSVGRSRDMRKAFRLDTDLSF